MDPFLFENFFTEDGDLLRAKFKAFKFPDSNFVLFKGVVNVCLDRCNSVECANGQLGYGRRRRRSVIGEGGAADQLQKLYEVSMSTIIRIEDEEPDASAAASVSGSELQPEPLASARQRQEQVIVEKVALEEEFGNIGGGGGLEEFGGSRFVEFELDEEDLVRNSAAWTQSPAICPILLRAVTLVITFTFVLVN